MHLHLQRQAVALNIVYVFAIVCICYVSFELNNFHGYNIIVSVI